ncbi:uncharacterized protein PG998_013791 [Apiospora kogelbergensis]|uniref:uncharacterized protein n=1 Tax=Apiospora kogelbergensis TaxID=1337665 RepID=UPI00312D8C33
MASTFDLNGAASEFSIRLIKEKVAALADECNRDLEGDLAQLRALLDHVDQKRLKFQKSKSDLLQGLRATLSSLQVDASMVNTTLADIAAASAPPLLSAIPTPSSFHLDSLLLTPAASPPESGLADTTKTYKLLDAASSDIVFDRDGESKATPGESSKINMSSESRAPVHREKRLRESPEVEIAEQEPKKAKKSPTKASTVLVYCSIGDYANLYVSHPHTLQTQRYPVSCECKT